MIYAFDHFQLDTRRGELRHLDHEVSLEPRAFALLCLLVQNHDRLVSKDEVLEIMQLARRFPNYRSREDAVMGRKPES